MSARASPIPVLFSTEALLPLCFSRTTSNNKTLSTAGLCSWAPPFLLRGYHSVRPHRPSSRAVPGLLLGACPRAHTRPFPTSRNRHALLLSYLTVSALSPSKGLHCLGPLNSSPPLFFFFCAQKLFKIVSCSSSRTFIIRPLTPSHTAFGIASFAIALFHFSVLSVDVNSRRKTTLTFVDRGRAMLAAAWRAASEAQEAALLYVCT